MPLKQPTNLAAFLRARVVFLLLICHQVSPSEIKKAYQTNHPTMMDSHRANTIPLFCVETLDKKSSNKLFLNFRASHEVAAPEIEIEEEKIVRAIHEPSPEIERYKIPMQLSQIYWSKSTTPHQSFGDSYVIDIFVNEGFGLMKVIPSQIIVHYLITVAMATIEQRECDKLDMDQVEYRILEGKLEIERSSEIVTLKVIAVIDESNNEDASKTASVNHSEKFDFHYRPKLQTLTCSLNGVEKIPDVISFNDDRILIKSDGSKLLDVYLPLNIDLTQPVRYKFDDRLCLLRIVFKTTERPIECSEIEKLHAKFY